MLSDKISFVSDLDIVVSNTNNASLHHIARFAREALLLISKCQILHIIFAVCFVYSYLGTSLEDNVVSIFMQFVPGGSVANLLARFGALEEEVFCRYTEQILEGVDYLHANNVIHR